jgi:uncharacterized protein
VNPLPSLHKAILDGNKAVIKKLCGNLEAITGKDRLGFTALEIAQFLNKRAAIDLLNPQAHVSIMAKLKGSDSLQQLSEKQFQQHFNASYLSHPAFPDYNEFKKVLANCPWLLAKSFLGEDNRSQAEEFSPQLKAGQCANISVRWIDEQLEYGVFADVDIPAGTYIGEFTGAIRQLSRRQPTHNSYCFHYPTRFWSWNYYVIDAQKMGNQTRFINHSDRPNLQPLCLCERRLLHIVFIAKVAIKADEQLTYDYGQDFWKTREKIDI